jgi:hypothetical protein
MRVARRSDLHLEHLVGRRVYDAQDRVVGRLEEFLAEREGSYWVVARYHIGPAALLERLAVRHLGVTWRGRARGYEAQWDQIDLADADHPRLTVPLEHLKAMRR